MPQFLQVAQPVSRTILMSVRCCAAVLRYLWLFVDCDCILRQESVHVQPVFVQASTVLGQSKAGLLNKVHALEAANVPANGTEVMKVDAS